MGKFFSTIILLGALFFALTSVPLCGSEGCLNVLAHKVSLWTGVSFPPGNSAQNIPPVALTQKPVASTSPQKLVSKKKPAESTPGALRVLEKILDTSTPLTPLGIISDTNAERAKEGIAALSENAQLRVAAEAKVDDMFARQYFEHVSPVGVGPGDLAKAAGYAYVSEGENLALGNFKDDVAVVTAWMNSPGHRANIMNTHFLEIGVAAKKGMFEGKEVWLAVQEFGVPLSACPAIDSALNGTIKTDKTQLATTDADLATRKQELNAMSPYDPAYNQKAEEYNALVRDYNALLGKVRELITEYNAQVNAFNTCAANLSGH